MHQLQCLVHILCQWMCADLKVLGHQVFLCIHRRLWRCVHHTEHHQNSTLVCSAATSRLCHTWRDSTGTGTNSHRQQKEGQLLWGQGRGDTNCFFSSKNTERENEFPYCISWQDLLTPWPHLGEIQHQQHKLNWLLFRTVPGCVGLL